MTNSHHAESLPLGSFCFVDFFHEKTKLIKYLVKYSILTSSQNQYNSLFVLDFFYKCLEYFLLGCVQSLLASAVRLGLRWVVLGHLRHTDDCWRMDWIISETHAGSSSRLLSGSSESPNAASLTDSLRSYLSQSWWRHKHNQFGQKSMFYKDIIHNSHETFSSVWCVFGLTLTVGYQLWGMDLPGFESNCFLWESMCFLYWSHCWNLIVHLLHWLPM